MKRLFSDEASVCSDSEEGSGTETEANFLDSDHDKAWRIKNKIKRAKQTKSLVKCIFKN